MKTIYITLGLATALLLGSCKKDFLETSPTTTLSDAEIEGTSQGVQMLVSGLHNMAYAYSYSDHFYARGYQGLATHYDLMSDDVINTRPAFHMSSYRWDNARQQEGGLTYHSWDYFFTLIQHANKALTSIENLGGATTDEVKRLRGNAAAFRAFAYHNLVQLYGKRYVVGQVNSQLAVPLRLTATTEVLPRATVQEIYDQIDKDINQALSDLEGLSDSGKKNDIRYSTACGIAARIALSKYDYASAEKYAELAISRSGARLQSGNALLDGFNNANATEWIWAYQQSPDQDFGYASFGAVFCYNTTSSYVRSLRFSVNRDLYDALGDKDVRRKWWVCYDKGDVIPSNANAAYFSPLSAGSTVPGWEATGQSIKFSIETPTKTMRNTLMMRLAEMYYIKAEAEARQNKSTEALATLTEIMKTRDVDYAYTLSSNDALIDEVMKNKRIDLWLEGQRFFDMKRLGVVPNRAASKNMEIVRAVMGEAMYNVAITRNTGVNATYIPKTVDDKAWEFAIPYEELKANPEMVINPL